MLVDRCYECDTSSTVGKMLAYGLLDEKAPWNEDGSVVVILKSMSSWKETKKKSM